MADALLHLFGTPRLEAADGRVHELPNNVPGWLAAWLALHGDWAAREAVALVFWPDRPEAAALHNLRANLHRLRAWLEGAGHGATLVTDKRRVRLTLASDVAAFRTACAAARWDDALAGPRGPLLQGLSLPGMAAVDAWCQAQRDSLADATRSAVLALAARWQAAGRARDAAVLLTRELERDLLSESLLQALLRLAPQAGAEADALAWFDRCTRRWADELGQAPLPATAALAASLRAPAPPARPASAFAPAPATTRSLPARLATPPLAGRAADLAWLQAAARQPGLVLLRGEPGVGKTRLVESGLPKALWWSCRPGDGLAAPLQPVADFLQDQLGSLRDHPVVQRHRARIARLMPELQAEDEAPAAAAPDAGLHSALAELFGALGRAIVVDDLQWADPQTLQLVDNLLAQQRLPLVATLRTHESTAALAATLARWQDAGRVQAHELAPLSAAALEQWVADLSGQPGGAPRFAQWLHARSAGNPLFALETLRTLFVEGRLRADDDGWHSVLDGLAGPGYDALTLPPRVAEVVRLRLAMLAPGTQRVLRLCAVTGDASWLEPLAALAQLTTPALGEALGEAQQAGVLHGRHFAHELLRQAVLEPVPEVERAAVHAGWLQLAGDRLTPHARATHAWGAGDRSTAVAATLAAATLDAQRGLHASAEERLSDAIARIDGSADDGSSAGARARLLAGRARVRLELGTLDAALDDAEATLAEDPGPETRAGALTVQGDIALLQGRVADVPALAAAALEAVPGHDGALMLRVKWSHAQGNFPAAEAALRERLAGLRRVPAGAALVDVLTSLATEIDYQGRHAEALPLHREAMALARRRGLRYAEVEAASNLLWCLPELGLHDEAVAIGEAAVALGNFDATPTLINNLAWLHLDQGRLDDAARLYGRLSDTDDPTIRCSARAKLLQIDATAGRPVEAAAQALLDTMRRTDHPQGLAIAALALLDHGPPASHAEAAALAPRVPVDPSLQLRLEAALARRGLRR